MYTSEKMIVKRKTEIINLKIFIDNNKPLEKSIRDPRKDNIKSPITTNSRTICIEKTKNIVSINPFILSVKYPLVSTIP